MSHAGPRSRYTLSGGQHSKEVDDMKKMLTVASVQFEHKGWPGRRESYQDQGIRQEDTIQWNGSHRLSGMLYQWYDVSAKSVAH